jgi:8-oxo-dGTP diphosphatase
MVTDDTGRMLMLLLDKSLAGGEECWELPGGIVEMDEELTDGLKREVSEETGLAIEIGEVFSTGSHWIKRFKFKDGRVKDVKFIEIVYKCTRLEGEVRLSDEHVDYMWADKERIRKMKMARNSIRAVEKYLAG